MSPSFASPFVILFLSLASIGARFVHAADTVSSAVFGTSKLARNSLALSSEESAALIEARRTALFEIRASGESFWNILTEGNPGAIDAANRDRLLKQFSSSVILVWGVPGEAPCPREAPAACSIIRDYSDVHAFGFVIDPCFMPSRAVPQCKREQRLYEGVLGKDPTLLGAVRRAMAHGAVRFADELRAHSDRRPIRERLEVLLADIEQASIRLRSISPGPFPKVFQALLTQSKLLKFIENSYVQACGKNYVGNAYGKSGEWGSLPGACREILDERRWLAWKASRTASAVRCGSACSELLGFSRRTEVETAEYFEGADETRPPRLLWFEKTALIDLPENACNGPDPARMEDFLRQSYLPFVVKPQFASRRESSSGLYELPAAWIPCLKAWNSGNSVQSGSSKDLGSARSRNMAAPVDLPATSDEVTFDLN